MVNKSQCPSYSHQDSGSCYLSLKEIKVSHVNIWDLVHKQIYLCNIPVEIWWSRPELNPKSLYMLICLTPETYLFPRRGTALLLLPVWFCVWEIGWSLPNGVWLSYISRGGRRGGGGKQQQNLVTEHILKSHFYPFTELHFSCTKQLVIKRSSLCKNWYGTAPIIWMLFYRILKNGMRCLKQLKTIRFPF